MKENTATRLQASFNSFYQTGFVNESERTDLMSASLAKAILTEIKRFNFPYNIEVIKTGKDVGKARRITVEKYPLKSFVSTNDETFGFDILDASNDDGGLNKLFNLGMIMTNPTAKKFKGEAQIIGQYYRNDRVTPAFSGKMIDDAPNGIDWKKDDPVTWDVKSVIYS